MKISMVFKHFKTVSRHRWIVFRECVKCGIWRQGITHDLSKFSPAEFLPSARYFQGGRSPIEAEKEECGYSLAWLHHKGRNPHHWEYWIDFNEDGEIICNKIPYKYVVEMVCDWIGAGKAYTYDAWTRDEPWNYYQRVKDGRHFHPETQVMIEDFLQIIKDKGLYMFYLVAKDPELRCIYEHIPYKTVSSK